MNKNAKRTPLRTTAILVVILFIVAVLIYFGGGYHGRGREVSERRTRVMFDTSVQITIEAPKDFDFPATFTKIWEELSVCEAAFDAYDSNSALFKLNNSDSSVVVPERLAKAISAGLAYRDSTTGAFNIKVGELVKLWDFAGDGHVPTETELTDALIGLRSLTAVHGDTVVKYMDRPIIDLGGLGKGFAADAVGAILDSIPQITRYLIDLGGNIRARDKKIKEFRIGVRHPRKPDEIAGSFILPSGCACATAGDYQRYFEVNGVRYHHILDPATGKPARNCSAVTVVASNALAADIYSTALFVLGPDKGMRLIKNRTDLKAAFFDDNGEYIDGNLKIE